MRLLCGRLAGLMLCLVCGAASAAPPRPETAEAIERALSVPSDTQPGLKLRGGPGVGTVRGLSGIVQDPTEPSPPRAAEPPQPVNMSDYTALIRNRPQTMALIHFDTDSARIRSDAYQLLNEYANALQSTTLANAVLLIAGHTDSVGSTSYNLSLSQRRAQAVKDYLIARGIAANRLVAKGYGEDYPIADNATESGRDENRRSEFVRLDVSISNN
jgi:outer membrane protein OmpA-like peptidoglycan-associated protein